MNKLFLMISVIALCFNAISESRAECVGADLNTVGTNESGNPCGICGTNCNWIVENKALKITGGTDGAVGTMKDYGFSEVSGGKYQYLTDNPWKDLEINSVDVQGVSNLGSYAFMGMGITNITIADTVTSIRDDALWGNKLTELDLPDSITYIGFGGIAYSSGKKIDTLVLPDSLTALGNFALDTGNVDTIIAPDTLAEISNHTFGGNPKIICKGTKESCQGLKSLLSRYCPDYYGCSEDEYVDLSENLTIAGVKECASTNYYWNGDGCVRESDKTKRSCCSGCKFDSGRCWRTRYTPAELAKVVGESNTVILYYK